MTMADYQRERDHWEAYAKRLQDQVAQLRTDYEIAWELIDKCAIYVSMVARETSQQGFACQKLLTEIEEMRKPRD